jgi:hypothetical protein
LGKALAQILPTTLYIEKPEAQKLQYMVDNRLLQRICDRAAAGGNASGMAAAATRQAGRSAATPRGVYSWCTEGLATAELQEAKVWLAELGIVKN